MVGRKFLKTVGVMAVGAMLMGMTASAEEHEYFFTLETSASRYSELYKKDTTNSYGYVSLTRPDPYTKIVHFNFVNDGFVKKSANKMMTKVGTANLSYSGYGVAKGDYLKLHAWNVTEENLGAQITAGGKFIL